MKFTKKKKILVVILVLIGILFLLPNDSSPAVVANCEDCKIKSVTIDRNVKISLPLLGDGWTSTLGNDGKLYLAFGDGTGKDTACIPADIENGQTYAKDNQCFIPDGILIEEHFCKINNCNNMCFTELCQYTPSGILSMTGNPPNLIQSGEIVIHVPYGGRKIFENNDKVSSLLFVGDRLYAHMLFPPSTSYLTYSDDNGKNWNIVDGVGWTGSSNFKTSFFVQLHDKDNFVYSMGVQDTINALGISQEVYLNRVDKNSIMDFSKYQYFSGLNENGVALWSIDESDAKKIDGLQSIIAGSVMYHKSLDRYLFLTGWDSVDGPQSHHGSLAPDAGTWHPFLKYGGLYESENVFGPYFKVGIFETGYDCNNNCFKEASLIPKGFTNDHFYFTVGWTGSKDLLPGAHGFEDGATYQLNIGKMQLQLES